MPTSVENTNHKNLRNEGTNGVAIMSTWLEMGDTDVGSFVMHSRTFLRGSFHLRIGTAPLPNHPCSWFPRLTADPDHSCHPHHHRLPNPRLESIQSIRSYICLLLYVKKAIKFRNGSGAVEIIFSLTRLNAQSNTSRSILVKTYFGRRL